MSNMEQNGAGGEADVGNVCSQLQPLKRKEQQQQQRDSHSL